MMSVGMVFKIRCYMLHDFHWMGLGIGFEMKVWDSFRSGFKMELRM